VSRPRILLADDHTLVLEAFTSLLEPEYEVVGTVLDGRELLVVAPKLKPDVIVLDISMPHLNGLDAANKLLSRLDVKLVFLTVNEDPDMVAEAFRIGAKGYLLKSSAATELFQAIQAVLEGKTYVTPLLTKNNTAFFIPGCTPLKNLSKLTVRQREVLQLLAEGNTMRKTAEILSVTPRTVAYHKYCMMEKLQINTNSELIQYAFKIDLVH